MPTTITRIGPDVAYSVFRFFQETTYTIGADTKTLRGHFANLAIVPAYPDDLVALASPTLALAVADGVREEQDFYGEAIAEDVYMLTAFGFVLGQGSDAANRRYRDRLLNDVVQLLRRVAQTEGVPLYDHATGAANGSNTLEVLNIRGRLVPANAPEIEAERYKLIVEAEIPTVHE